MTSKLHCCFIQLPDNKQGLAVTRIRAGERKVGQLQNFGEGHTIFRQLRTFPGAILWFGMHSFGRDRMRHPVGSKSGHVAEVDVVRRSGYKEIRRVVISWLGARRAYIFCFGKIWYKSQRTYWAQQ